MSKNVFITGASSGLGKQMALEFASRGYNLALTARREDILVDLKEQIQKAYKVEVFVLALDVLEYEQTQQAIDSAAAALGSIDKVIANAGIGSGGRIGDSGAFVQARDVINTNVVGAMATIDAATAFFRRQGHGHVITLSSVAAFRGLPGSGAYSASKAAISVYSEALRAETYDENIDVTVLLPGYIDTPINNSLKSRPFLIDLASGGRILADLIEKKVKRSTVPPWPWGLVARIIALLPTAVVAKTMG